MTTSSRFIAFAFAAFAVVLVTSVAAVATPRVVEAHAEHDRSTPAAGSVIPRAPDTLEIWFTQELFRREGANTIVVEGPTGRVDDGNVVLDDADRTHLTVGLDADLAPGEYRVAWTSLSGIDGDAAEGEFTFTIDPNAPEPTPAGTEVAATPEATPTPVATVAATASASDNDEGGTPVPSWVLVVAASILGSAALAGWLLLRGDPDSDPDGDDESAA